MVSFLIVWGFCSLTIGAFVGAMVSSDVDDRRKILKPIVGILIAALVGLIITGMIYTEQKSDGKNWNDGYCEICGGEWELNSVTTSRNGFKTYYWDCKDCGHVIETSAKFK